MTDYHSQYFAYELTKRLASDNAEKLSQSLLNATVDLNPHQVEAALFAFRSPLSRGAVLADEVGLGKTIEAGLIVSQLWAERKRRILCIVPASLRKQWNRELHEKFFIPSDILEAKSYKAFQKQQGGNPFERSGLVVLCSYEFARSKMADVQNVPWDLVILDEAHRVRNVYKKSNKIARAIRDGLLNCPKILLTATPLQNSLMELYGLISFVDPHMFGDEDSFRSQFATRRLESAASSATADQFASLRNRIKPICHRTLRRQVTEYVSYTQRISITQDFTPTDAETQLYESVSNFLQKEELVSLPASQRQLITLILRKILASSSFAITATLGSLISRLETQRFDLEQVAESQVTYVIGDDIEHSDELQEEWSESDEDAPQPDSQESDSSKSQANVLAAIAAELTELKSYKKLAESITVNAKGEALRLALQVGFRKAKELGSPSKALIFTESRRTQLYLKDLLEECGYGGQIVTFNGTNTDPESKQIYAAWLKAHAGEDCITGSPSADMRAALVEKFKNDASIMIATESAAEGVNLQFCNVVVNYDLPWNPQRIEQRIGRCHRYGQKFDVVVINFLNRKNEADQRVFQLLEQKFRLFDGVFGASDEVLGTLESGVDFEKRILQIHQRCRTTDEIKSAFDTLQRELEDQINSRREQTRASLLENFDVEVHEKLRLRKEETERQISRYERWLWQLLRIELYDVAEFDDEAYSLNLLNRPEGTSDSIPLGMYVLNNHKQRSDAHSLRFDHPLVTTLLEKAKARELSTCEIIFNHSDSNVLVSLAKKHLGESGWLRVSLFSITALEVEQHLVLTGFIDDGGVLEPEECTAFFAVPATFDSLLKPPITAITRLDELNVGENVRLLEINGERNLRYFSEEEEKLDRWAEDLKECLERDLQELACEIRRIKKESRIARSLEKKIELQQLAQDMTKKHHQMRKSIFAAHDEIETKRDNLIDETMTQLKQSIESRHLFTVRWSMK